MEKKDRVKTYSKGDLSIIWKPGLCIHAALCVKALPDVYRPGKSPWIAIENASHDALITQINTCPSGALSYKLKSKEDSQIKDNTMEHSKVAGKAPVIVGLEEGKSYAWCACGGSSNQPWCDGSHKGTGISPVVIKAAEAKKAAMCMCKQSGNKPYCDGAHTRIG